MTQSEGMQDIFVEVLIEISEYTPPKGPAVKIKDVFALRALGNHIAIPKEFFDDIESYAIKLSAQENSTKIEDIKICSRCLDNYILLRAKERGFDDIILRFLNYQFATTLPHASFCPRKKLA